MISPRRSLRSDFVWTFLGNGLYAVAQWAIIVLLAKLTDPTTVGNYSFAVAVATPLVTFASFQVRVVQMTDKIGEYRFSDYLGFRLLCMAAALFVLSVICVSLHYAPFRTALVEAIGLTLAIEAVSDIFYGRMQSHDRMDSIAKSMMIRGLVGTAALISVLLATGSLLFGVVASLAVRALTLGLCDSNVRLTLDGERLAPHEVATYPSFRMSSLRRLLATTLPIGLVAVLISLNTSIPRYYIESSAGARELGIFAALCFFPSAGNLIVGALSQAAFNRLADSYWRAGVAGFLPLLAKLVALGLLLGGVGILTALVGGARILELMYRREYASRPDLLVYLMIAATLGFCCQFIGVAVTAARIFKPQLFLFAIVGLTLTGCCYSLVPSRGVSGAITAMIAASAVQIVGFAVLLGWSVKFHRSGQRKQLDSRPDFVQARSLTEQVQEA